MTNQNKRGKKATAELPSKGLEFKNWREASASGHRHGIQNVEHSRSQLHCRYAPACPAVASDKDVKAVTFLLFSPFERSVTISKVLNVQLFSVQRFNQSVLVATLRVRPQDLRFRYFPIKSRTKTSGEESNCGAAIQRTGVHTWVDFRTLNILVLNSTIVMLP